MGHPAPRSPLYALEGGEGRNEVRDAKALADTHLALPTLRAGPLPLSPEGWRGEISRGDLA
jgi:hypothetical protein